MTDKEVLELAIKTIEKLSYEYGRLLDGEQEYGLLPSEVNADIIQAYHAQRLLQHLKETLTQSKKQKWQSLSNVEIENACGISQDGNYWNLCLDIAKSIEKALKDKNYE